MLKNWHGLKYLLGVVILFGCAIYVSQQYQRAREQCAKECEQVTPRTVAPSSSAENCDECQKNAERHLPRWYRLFGWPEGITTWAILLTLLAIAEQTRETAKAASASSKEADIARTALIAQFRPKIVLRSIRLIPPNWAIYEAQKDRMMKIEIVLVNGGSTSATVETCELELLWMREGPQITWQTDQSHICSRKWDTFSVRPSERHRLEVDVPSQDIRFAGPFAMQTVMAKNRNGQNAWPTCIGTIVYVDENGHRRQTGFHRRWDIASERFVASEDQEEEYED